MSVESKLKKTYAIFSQLMYKAQADGVVPPSVSGSSHSARLNSCDQLFQLYFAPYLKISKYCKGTVGCGLKYGEIKTLSHENPVWYTNKSGYGSIASYYNHVEFILSNGVYVSTDVSGTVNTSNYFGVFLDDKYYHIQIYIDVNGPTKPNVIGKDIYIFDYYPSKGFVPAGYSRTEQEVKDNCENGNGYWCASYVLKNNFKISDKTWKR